MSTLVKVNCDRADGRKHSIIVTPQIIANYGCTEVDQKFIDKFNEINKREYDNCADKSRCLNDPTPVVSWHIGVM